MLEVASKKNGGKAYKELKELFLGTPETYPKDLTDRFDMVTATGILA